MNAPFSPPTELQGLRGLRGMLAAIGSVGPVDGFDVIRRASVLELADRYISMGEQAPEKGHWIAAEDVYRNVRELDVAFNGDGAAEAPLLIDVLSQVAGEARKLGMPILTALKMGKPIGYVIEHADGTRWRTMDSIGMPAWTNDKAEALCVSLRMHAERFSEDDEEDIRIKPVWEMPRMDGETVESVIACLGDDAATLRDRNPDCEIAANMERAAELLVTAPTTAMLRTARTALIELFDRCNEVKTYLDKDIPNGEAVHPASSMLTWPMSTAVGAIRETSAAAEYVEHSQRKHRAELYQEVWERSKALGYPNVTMALAALVDRASAAAVAEHHVEELDKIFSAVMGCFDAAYIEGLDQALAQSVGSEPGSLHDLVARRIMPVYSIVKAAKLTKDAAPAPASASFIGVSESADFTSDSWVFIMKPPYQVGAGEYLITPLASRKNTVGDAA